MPQLVFHSTEANYSPTDLAGIILGLQEAGFIGDMWEKRSSDGSIRYLVGDKFLSLVTFMGCAPAIELEPDPENDTATDFCHVEFTQPLKSPAFIRGKDFLVARCPECRHRLDDWNEIPASLRYQCDKCGADNHLSNFDWKNSAGCGRFFIRLHGVYPQEAIPTSSLLNMLEEISGTSWNYFYIQQ